EVVEEIRKLDRRAAAIAVDLTGTGQLSTLTDGVTETLENWGAEGLDIVINNAGVSSHQPFGSITEEEFDRVVDINYKSVVFLTQALLPQLRDNGRIVVIGSGLSRFSLAGMGIYGSLKAAVERFMAYLATELGPRGITANAVSPGALDTDFNAAALEHNPQMRGFISSVTALGRMGLAQDVG
ncbi:MAG: SDR family oxidoreductase, partial [Actinomycetota bacterium]